MTIGRIDVSPQFRQQFDQGSLALNSQEVQKGFAVEASKISELQVRNPKFPKLLRPVDE